MDNFEKKFKKISILSPSPTLEANVDKKENLKTI